MPNIVFRKQSSKGDFSAAHVKAYNEAPSIAEAGSRALKGREAASNWAKQVSLDNIQATEKVNQVELESRDIAHEFNKRQEKRIFEALQANRRTEIANIKTEGANWQRNLQSIAQFTQAGAQMWAKYETDRRADIDEDTKSKVSLLTDYRQKQDLLNLLSEPWKITKNFDNIEKEIRNKFPEGPAREILNDLASSSGYARESARRILARSIASDPALLTRISDQEVSTIEGGGTTRSTIGQQLKLIASLAGSHNPDFHQRLANVQFRELDYYRKSFENIHEDSKDIILAAVQDQQEKRRSGFQTKYDGAQEKVALENRKNRFVEGFETWKKSLDNDPEASMSGYLQYKIDGLKNGKLKKSALNELLTDIDAAVRTGALSTDDARWVATATLQAHGAKAGEKKLPIHRFVGTAVENLLSSITELEKAEMAKTSHLWSKSQKEQQRTILGLNDLFDRTPIEQQTPAFFQRILQTIDPSDKLVYDHVSAIATHRTDTNDKGFELAWQKDMIVGKLDSKTIRKSGASNALKIEWLNKLADWNKGQPKTMTGIAQLKTNWEASRDAIIAEYGYFGDAKKDLDSSVSVRIGMAEAKYHARVQHYIDKEGMGEGDASYQAYQDVLKDIERGAFKPIDRITEGGGTAADLSGLTYTFDIESETPDSLYLQLKNDPKKIILDEAWFKKYEDMVVADSRGKTVNFGTLPLWNLVTYTASTTRDKTVDDFIENELNKLNEYLAKQEKQPIKPVKNEKFDNNMNIFNEAYHSTSPSAKQAMDLGRNWTGDSLWILKYETDRIESGNVDFWRDPTNFNILSPFTQKLLEEQGATQ